MEREERERKGRETGEEKRTEMRRDRQGEEQEREGKGKQLETKQIGGSEMESNKRNEREEMRAGQTEKKKRERRCERWSLSNVPKSCSQDKWMFV